jgi:hypothetical protein
VAYRWGMTMSTMIGARKQEQGRLHVAAGAMPTDSRRAMLRTLLGVAGGLVLAGGTTASVKAAFEDGWQLCTRCRGLVRTDDDRPCPAGGVHALATTANYALAYAGEPPPNHETGWRWCQACGLLTYLGGGPCPATGTSHTPSDDVYHVEYNQPLDVGEVSGWRYCPKCEGLFRPKRRKRGVCPADGRHKSYPGYTYNLYDYTYDL